MNKCCKKCRAIAPVEETNLSTNIIYMCIKSSCSCHDSPEKKLIDSRMNDIKENLRLMNYPPIISTKDSSWEERFDKAYPYKIQSVREASHRNCKEEIKSFIRDLIKSEREEIRREVEGIEFKMNVDEYLPLVKRWNGTNYDLPFDDGFKSAKNTVLSILTQKE